MGCEGPFLSAIIARLSEPKFNLAAFGVAFSLAILIEAPVIMLMSASTALVKDYTSYKKLFKFTICLNGLITLIMLILAIPSVFFFVAEKLIGLPGEVSSLTYYSIIFFIPWPAAIGFRRFYQGVLIYHNQTRRVFYGTIVRLVSMALTGLTLYRWGRLSGAYVGAIALSMGVCAECLASRIMVHKIFKELQLKKSEQLNYSLSYVQIFTFYLPLALTSVISLGAHPIVTFFVGKSRMPVESLAALPVVGSFVFIFRSFGLSFQEAVLALVGNRFQNYRLIRNFAFLLGLVLTVCIAIISFTPLIEIWYRDISGLTLELVKLAIPTTFVLIAMPFLETLLAFQRGLQVNGRKTTPITIATAIELCGIIIMLFLGIFVFNLIGAIAAAIALLVGRLGANIYLNYPNNRIIQRCF